MDWYNNNFSISSDKSRLNLSVIHAYLSKDAYWCQGVPEATVTKAIQNSLCFGIYQKNEQVGFARLVTDKATFAYLADVFVLPDFQGQGLSKWLMECILEHPDLQGLRRIALMTGDAHGLYERYGFKPAAVPENYMEKHNPTIYQ
ncbi:GNAT family N-acetyltransferase [Endozoicomonas sp. OPT23]|uniref:GNAT family N-acetyltransferase n=1 Tax=Endozoicomonas sp. OPT23 TaxID=2072845 RepID=UPI00129AF3B5|nr:GNAT family N-acetyltransferase [Endozoicomonas sp. OPT23]MRI32937.1 GNAT family N-acetyltransferase [Endozoicomonas sp. OPT23]